MLQKHVLGFCSLLLILENTLTLKLTILHTNDVHSHFEETNERGGSCDRSKSKCFGGIARQKTKIDEIKRTQKNVIFLNAGDYFQGTLWYTLFKWEVVARFANLLPHSAMAYGNHEFDDGIKGIIPFVNNVTFPVISCNINASQEPEFAKILKKSVVLEVEGRKIGIIGYSSVKSAAIANTGDLKFLDEIMSIQKEVDRLKKTEDIKIFIALGHSGYSVDMEIANEIGDIDIVVGGHSHSFLYTGQSPSVETPEGPYPTRVKQKSGKKVYVVQSYTFGKYLGKIDLEFDNDGEIIKADGSPILLTEDVPEDEEVLKHIRYYSLKLNQTHFQTFGNTQVYLEGSGTVCRLKECNLGNLLTDASILQTLNMSRDKGKWNDVSIGLWNSGGIRIPISKPKYPAPITLGDILSVIPFQNYLDVISLKGEYLWETMEQSVKEYNPKNSPGGFLQVSGLQVIYDLCQPSGKRVVSINVRCSDCLYPAYEPIDFNKTYRIVLPSFIADGKDDFSVLLKHKFDVISDFALDLDIMKSYLSRNNPVIIGIEGRIKFHRTLESCNTNEGRKNIYTKIVLMVTLILTRSVL